MKVLLELRPAFDGHSGIPQETRLLFRGLVHSGGIEAIGLIQSGNLVVDPGLPMRRGAVVESLAEDERVDRLSLVVVSLQQGSSSHRFEHIRRTWAKYVGTLMATIGSLFGRRVALTAFDPRRYQDFVWRSMFGKSLPDGDFAAVTAAQFRILRWPWSILHTLGVMTSWVGRATYPRLDTDDIDVVIAETPMPTRVSRRTRLVVRYHDAIPLLMPHTIKQRGYHRSAHFQALRRNALDGAWFACVSDSTRHDLLSVLPAVAERAVTIPNMVSHHFYVEEGPPSRVPEVIWSRKNRRAPHEGGAGIDPAELCEGALSYLLIVCTIEPRKNHLTLVDAWEKLRHSDRPMLNLVVVGSLGWDHQAIVERFTPWLRRGGLHMLLDVPADDLRLLYRHAAVTVCPSYGEGFDFPGVEAMRSGGVVAASDIPVHRDVFGEACEYFSPYAPGELAEAIRRLTGPEAVARRATLVHAGADQAARYLPDRVMPMWQAFLERVAGADQPGRA